MKWHQYLTQFMMDFCSYISKWWTVLSSTFAQSSDLWPFCYGSMCFTSINVWNLPDRFTYGMPELESPICFEIWHSVKNLIHILSVLSTVYFLYLRITEKLWVLVMAGWTVLFLNLYLLCQSLSFCDCVGVCEQKCSLFSYIDQCLLPSFWIGLLIFSFSQSYMVSLIFLWWEQL